MEQIIEDPRLFHKYPLSNLLCQGLFMFMTGESSRNATNNRAAHSAFYKENFHRMFGMEWAHMDTADNLFRILDWESLEQVKAQMLRLLIEKKRIKPSFCGKYLIAIDATGITSYDEEAGRQGLVHKTSKGGKRTYLNIMLEAKLVTPEGLSLSLASEPLSNQDLEAYEKQDCELKAFSRIAGKIKKLFPRLPICLLLDGLYPNTTVFACCQANGWKYIVNLKDGSLAYLQQDIKDTTANERLSFEQVVGVKQQRETFYETAHYQSIEGLHHKQHEVNWVECYYPHPRRKPGCDKAELTRFTYLTNMDIQGSQTRVKQIVQAGRLRWKIENEGFNTQKNQGYHLHHKYSRCSVATLHVYYMLMQMAHIINQLVLHTKEVIQLRTCYKKLTVRYLWDNMRHILANCVLCYDRLMDNKTRRCQIRLE